MQILRAEDMQAFDGGIGLGGRSVLAGSIVSVQAQKRVSAEFIGFAGVIVACVVVAVLSRSGGVAAGALCLSAILALGAAREMTHPYVLVLEVFQMGTFEARGFTHHAIAEALGAVEALRVEGKRSRGATGVGVSAATGESSF
jgi:hypothetical protein